MIVEERNRNIKESNYYKLIAFCGLSVALIVLAFRIQQYIIVIPTVLISVLIILEDDSNKKLAYLFFFLPFSQVLKIEVNTISLYTLIQFAFLGTHLFVAYKEKTKININVVMTLLLFSIYSILNSVFNNNFPVVEIINLIAGYLIIYFSLKNITNRSFEICSISFILGMIISSTIGLFLKYIPRLQEYLTISTITDNSNHTSIERYAGLWNDPNSFSTLMLMAIGVSTLLYFSKKITFIIYEIIFLTLSIIGIKSLSKMFILGIIIIVLLSVAIEIKRNVLKGLSLLTGYTLSIIGFIIIFPDMASTYTYRFSGIFSETISAANFTTGRTDIWITYFHELVTNGKWIFGNGLAATLPYGRAAHNTIIQILYALGIVGFMFYLLMLLAIVKTRSSQFLQVNSRNYMNHILIKYFPTIILLWASLSLDLFKHDYFILMILLCILAAKIQINVGTNNRK